MQEVSSLKHNSHCSSPSVTQLPATCLPTQALCLLLVVDAVVSFRSVPRILLKFADCLGLDWIPHFTTVINWTLRLGLSLLQSATVRAEKWIAIIDGSIDLGARKALVVLRIPLDLMSRSGGEALKLSDCECVGVKISGSWNGERVAQALSGIFLQVGQPAAVLSDQGGDLRRGVRLWAEQAQIGGVPCIHDVGHYFANILKRAYDRLLEFRKFMDLVTRGSAQIKHTDLAAMAAPSLGSHNRFFKIALITTWAGKILDVMAMRRKSKPESVPARVHKVFSGFYKMRHFLRRLIKDCRVTNTCLTLLKKRGLNQQTYEQAKELLKELPQRSVIAQEITGWLDRHIEIQRRLEMGDIPLPVSSDILESLMGKFKTIIQRCHHAEFNRLSLAFPVLCGHLDEDTIQEKINKVSQQDILNWQRENVPKTLRQLRQQNLPPKPHPQGLKTGSFNSS